MRLLVTRPEDDAARTAQALRARGHDALIAPLLRIETIPADTSGSYDAIAVTSANAARAAILRDLPVLAVGDRSAQAARDAGYAQVESAGGALTDLVALAAKRFPKGRILYLAGADRAGDLAADLARRGIAVDTAVVYRAVAADALPPEALRALRDGQVDGVLHYSGRSAETLLRLADAAGVLNAVLSLAHYCLSAEVAEPLRARGAATLPIAASPQEAALIDLIGPP
jgi:uroporphyrinogen-III synthase